MKNLVPIVDKNGNPIKVGDPVRFYPNGIKERDGVVDRIGYMDRREFGDVCGHVLVVDPNHFDIEESVPAYTVPGGAACYDLEKVP